jgi:folate-binding protein YgfZ
MAETYLAVLEDRGVLSVAGPDAGKLLGGLITNEMSSLDTSPTVGVPSLHAALLSPQGKILFDFIVVKTADGFLLDTAREKAGELVKRLSMYKLRAAVEIRDVSDAYRVVALWGDQPAPSTREMAGSYLCADPRLPALGFRIIADVRSAEGVPAGFSGAAVPAQAYHVHRIGLGVPEGGRDFAFGDTFPHEALLDQLNGVSFTKGCFVGQEVVSRMQHRTSVRKRVVPVVGEQALPQGPLPVLAGEVEIGRLGSVAGARGLALLRIDRVAEARRDGIPLTIGGEPISVEVPAFATFRIEVAA